MPPVARNVSSLIKALEVCLRSSFAFTRVACSEGLFHAFVEYTDFDKNWHPPIEYMYPCNWVALSEQCFHWIFGQGLTYHVDKFERTPRYFEMLSHPQHITSICLQTRPFAAEENRRGCIWGMSANFYLLFHEIFVASRNGTASPLESCRRVITFGIQMWPSVNCPILLKENQLPSFDYSLTSLDAWCSFFVPLRDQHKAIPRDVLRWRSCIHGSLYYSRGLTTALQMTTQQREWSYQQKLYDRAWDDRAYHQDFLTATQTQKKMCSSLRPTWCTAAAEQDTLFS